MFRKYFWLLLLVCFSAIVHAGEMTIQTPIANVREGAAVRHRVIATVTKGMQVTPLRIEENYLEVSFGEGRRRGWLYFPGQGWSAEQVRAELESAPLVAARVATPSVAVGAQAPGAPDLALTTLAELGFRRGYMFEGLQSGHQKVFRFVLPRVAAIRGGKLRLGFSAATGLSERSVLRVDVNHQPVYSASPARIASGGGVSWVELPLSRALLAAAPSAGVLDVVVSASLVGSDDRCMDERSTASFLHLDPASGLELDLAPAAGHLLAAWEMLPKHVTLSVPAKVQEHTFASALVLVHQLVREGKTVEVVRLPRLGDVVVADADALRAAVSVRQGAESALQALAAPGNARIVSLPGQQVVAFSGPATEWPVKLGEAGWMSLARASEHAVGQAGAAPGRVLPTSLAEVSFDVLGADVLPRNVVRSAEWRLPLAVDRVPAGRVPEYVRLDVISAPVPDDRPMMLYAYLNEELQDVQRLNGGAQQLTLHFAPSAARGAFNELRLVVQRDVPEGDCRALSLGYPVQIGRGSSVVFASHESMPQDFGAVPSYFSRGLDVLIGAELLEQPEQAMVFLSNLFEANRYPLAAERVRFVSKGMKASAGPFLLLGEGSSELSNPAVRFDRGQVVVKGHDGATILDLAGMRDITVAQLVDWGGQRGMWIKPPAEGAMPATAALSLTFDSVAFLDDKGVVLTLSPELRDVARVTYPAYRNWFDLFGTYRYWFMVLGWILVVALLAQLYLKVRSHKQPR